MKRDFGENRANLLLGEGGRPSGDFYSFAIQITILKM